LNGHGAFTKTLLEGIDKQKADYPRRDALCGYPIYGDKNFNTNIVLDEIF